MKNRKNPFLAVAVVQCQGGGEEGHGKCIGYLALEGGNTNTEGGFLEVFCIVFSLWKCSGSSEQSDL